MTNEQLELLVLYSQLPKIACQQRCQQSCISITMSQAEWDEVVEQAGTDQLYSDEATHRCPLLKDGRCSVYEHRPMICRLWGLTKAMACPFGCEPARWLSDDEANFLLHRANMVSGGFMHGIFPKTHALQAHRMLEQDAVTLSLRER